MVFVRDACSSLDRVYPQVLRGILQLRKCPACGAGGSATINEDAFGAFKVVVDANNNRKVAREGSKFLYDDAADSLIRMLWPERVQDYVNADVDRERVLHLASFTSPLRTNNQMVSWSRSQHYRTAARVPYHWHAACRTTA